MQQNYDYDHLNRIKWVAEYPDGNGAGSTGSQWFGYDRYGNRTIDPASWGTGINEQQFTINATKNQYGVPAGQTGVMQYDAAGNLYNDTYSGTGMRTFDAENRMVTATNAGGQQSIYTYHANGSRVRRKSYGVETWQVYGMDGELLAEYAAGAAPTSPQKEYGYRTGRLLVTAAPGADVRWIVADHLGTPRIIADRTGSLAGIRRHDYLPFGEELYAGTGNRTTQQGYPGSQSDDGVRQQFTRKERDTETALDYFGARYYPNAFGRFISVDPIKLTAERLLDPQILNLYNYCRNNPLVYIDPDGEDIILANATARAQARANIDRNINASERQNIQITGDRVTLVNPAAVTKGATDGYKLLLQYIGPNSQKTANYYGLKPGETVTIGKDTYTYEQVQKGGDVVIYSSANTVELLVAVGGTTVPDTGNPPQPIPFPEHLVFAHGLIHGTCGQGMCAVQGENKLRQEQGVPLRNTSVGHEILVNGQLRDAPYYPPQQVNVDSGSPDLIPPTQIAPLTEENLILLPALPLPPN